MNTEWKWYFDKGCNVWFGVKVGGRDNWELRIYHKSNEVIWEAWNYQESDPIMTSRGCEKNLDKAFYYSVNYVKEVEVESR